ncbi:Oidioi.mRNA.OKI2018_I69.chr1.g2195.t1.cds [Oikopleura dioica]|uniref:Oidioi.mRNA.OKI2018_I69.chr1.g2195.t1.cds n=1 Tax=Oikopleura dioica TaxID=34765 RepID=A0ABN7SU90_OIKDI|nr:Oidioi.mRNA.OKI2018_I69.chr1.g2195.t1.cds [Oikopleura dioica]
MVVRPASSQSNNVKATEQEMDVIMTDPFKYVSDHVKRKIRNLEKRKEKLDGYKAKLAKGDKLNNDQHEAIAKYGEVIGMLTFATEITGHLTGLENSVKKERKKRNRREQIKQQQEKMDLMARAIETLTLMHLPEAHEEPSVSPLRDQTLFSPSPGVHLADCSADTAKLLVDIFDEDKADAEVFSTDDGPVTYKQVRDTLDSIRPKYNPVPEYDDQTTPDETIDENVDGEENGHEQLPEDETYENGGDTEVSSPVVVNDEVSQIDDEYVEVSKEEVVEAANNETEQRDPPTLDSLDFQQPSLENIPMPQVQTPLEFVNREVYGEEQQIQEILVEVSSGFNFLAPADVPVEEQEPEEPAPQGISFGFDYNSTVQGFAQEPAAPEPVAPSSSSQQLQAQHQLQQQQQQQQQHQMQSHQAPANLQHQQQQPSARQESNYTNRASEFTQPPPNPAAQRPQQQRQAPPQQYQPQHSPPPTEDQKDNLTWQQQLPAQKSYRGGSSGGNYSYKNSQRYQRSFQGGNRVNGEGDGHNRGQRVNGGGPRGVSGQYRRGGRGGAPQKK